MPYVLVAEDDVYRIGWSAEVKLKTRSDSGKSSRRANYGRTHVFHQEGDRTPKFKVTTKGIFALGGYPVSKVGF